MTGDGTAMTDGKGAAPAGGGGKQRVSERRLQPLFPLSQS